MATGVILSKSATDKLASLLDEEGNPNLKLRIHVTGGGCSGLQYNFMFDETTSEEDVIIDSEYNPAIKVVIDSMSYFYLKEAEIDYRENIQGGGFVINNPNASSTCGCGSSFAMDDE